MRLPVPKFVLWKYFLKKLCFFGSLLYNGRQQNGWFRICCRKPKPGELVCKKTGSSAETRSTFMKKKTLLISAISVVLAVLIALGGIWFLFFKGDSGNIVDVLRLTTVDEILLQEDFTSTPGGDLPKGWVKTFPYKKVL